jgi:uncharacterized membrane protein
VCNETSFMVEAAKAWRTPSGLAVEGWTRIAPGGCAEIGPATDTEQYLYARSTRAYLGGVREWRGSLDICVDEAISRSRASRLRACWGWKPESSGAERRRA